MQHWERHWRRPIEGLQSSDAVLPGKAPGSTSSPIDDDACTARMELAEIQDTLFSEQDLGLVAMSFQTRQWLFPIAVTFHNSEEALWLPAGWTRHAKEVPVHPGTGAFR